VENNETNKQTPAEEDPKVEEPNPEDKQEAPTNEWRDIHSFLTSPEGLQVLDARLKQLLGE
jgi:hypothetical protein